MGGQGFLLFQWSFFLVFPVQWALQYKTIHSTEKKKNTSMVYGLKLN